jgi:micrococcal nuclease
VRWWGAPIVVGLVVVALLANDAADRGEPGDDPAGGAGDSARADVQRVVDGDTIEVELEGRTESVRYIGVDTPETPKPGTPGQCFAEEASAFNEALVAGERVRLVFDRERRDRYGRLLAYVYVGGLSVNAELVRGGYARTLEIEPNTAMAPRLAALERRAGRTGRGLWSSC